MSDEIRFDRSMLGKKITLEQTVFSHEVIDHYLVASGEATMPADEHGPFAPPLIAMAFVGDLPEIRLEWGSRGFLASQVFWPETKIRPGDEVTTTSTLTDVYQKTGRSGHLVFIVWETELVNQRGEIVARCRRSFARQE